MTFSNLNDAWQGMQGDEEYWKLIKHGDTLDRKA